PIRCAATLPSIRNVRGRSPRPIWVMTSSTRRHGAIHSRHTMKATTPNAPQIKTAMSQDTAFLFSSKYLFAAKRVRRRFAISNHFAQVLVRHGSLLRQLWSAGRPRTAFAPTPLLFAKAIAETAHSFNRVAGLAEFFAQSANVRVHGAGVDYAFVAPDVVEQFIALLHPASALD